MKIKKKLSPQKSKTKTSDLSGMPEVARTVSCPTCRKPAVFASTNPYRPFCSKRCQIIDLGEWASENRKIISEK